MSDFLDVISFRDKKDGGKTPHRIGYAKQGDKGMNVYLDSLPLPDKDGRVSFLITVQRERTGRPTAQPKPRQTAEFDDDEPLPF